MAFPRVNVTDVTRAEPAPYGILSPAATVVVDTDDRWAGGFNYESLDCGSSSRITSLCSAVSGVQVISAQPADKWRSYNPFSIETEFTGSTFGAPDYDAIARDRMEACQQKTIEREFWRGDLARAEQAANPQFPNRFLASTSAVNLTPTAGTPVKPKFGMALLEDALGTCGCGVRGTIHMTRGTASSLGLSGADATLTTPMGNFVIAGAGYDGSGANGVMPSGTSRWIYATGPVTVRLGEVTTRADAARSTNTSNNEVKAYADRPAAVTWDTCCHFAVLVDLALDYS